MCLDEILNESKFEIGGKDVSLQDGDYQDKIRIKVGTLLKADTVSFLLGAGVSVECGGVLFGSVPDRIEQDLLKEGIHGVIDSETQPWLDIFYLAIRSTCGNESVPSGTDAIIQRSQELKANSTPLLPANFEQVLTTLHRWRSALPEEGGEFHFDVPLSHNIKSEDLDNCIKYATNALACACNLPLAEKENNLSSFKTLLRKILTRPLNLKRVNIFTLNYDTLIEQASDSEGIVLLDGFVGTQCRIFRPESYKQDLYFPAETTEGRVHRFDRVLHLYKLHGSITWVSESPTLDNPYGITSKSFNSCDTENRLLIYPLPSKYGATLAMPYSELFRRFGSALVQPQSVLFVIGYGFGDEHVNAIIRQALAVPSFTLVIVDPDPKSDFVKKLSQQEDRRVWIIKGGLGYLTNFVKHILPDLRDEEINKKVLETLNALRDTKSGG